MDFAAEPIKYNCGHFICIQCDKTLSSYGFTDCPVCRAKVDRTDEPVIDTDL
jgi:hypothetical protein